MADIADDAQDLIELTVAAAVSRTKSKKFNNSPTVLLRSFIAFLPVFP